MDIFNQNQPEVVEEKPVETPAVEAVVETEKTEDNEIILADFVDDTDNDTPANGGDADKAENKQWWETAKEKLGIEAENEDDFVKKATTPKFVDDRDENIRSLKELIRKPDEDLVRAELKAKGWNQEKIDKRIEQLTDREELEFAAEDIRSGLNAAISERQSQINKTEQDSLRQAGEFKTSVNKNISEALSKTTELFGFKVGRNDEEVAKWQKGMESYFTKDGFNKDLSQFIKDAHDKNPQALIELAQFIKSREGVFKGLVQKGKSQATKEILSELRNEKTPKEGERKEERKSEGFAGFLK